MAALRNPARGWNFINGGKIRDVYESQDGRACAIVASDRVPGLTTSVIGDVVVPGKGKIITEISERWNNLICDEYGYTSALICTNVEIPIEGFDDCDFNGRVTLQEKLRIFPVKFIVRGFLTGVVWKEYQEGRREICGNKLINEMQDCQQFFTPIFTPVAKIGRNGAYEEVSFSQMIDIINRDDMCIKHSRAVDTAEEIRRICLDIYEICYKYALEHGIIIADTKIELGLDEDGDIYIADELMTPDVARYWSVDRYCVGRTQGSFDKHILRDYVAKHLSAPGRNYSFPDEVIEESRNNYEKILQMLFPSKPDAS